MVARILTLTILTLQTADVVALEEPQYELLSRSETIEIRRYAPYLVAEVTVTGSFDETGNDAFGILANYIFGGNREETRMSMTAPVESQPAADEMIRSQTTAAGSLPAATAGEAYTYSFVMEQQYSMETLPAPDDPRISIMQRPAAVMAVRRFSGRWTSKNYDANEAALLDELRLARIDVLARPKFARYNAPFRPPFMRRNEVMVEIGWQQVRNLDLTLQGPGKHQRN